MELEQAVMTGLYHHSRLRAFRSPQGALPWNERLRLTLAAKKEYPFAAVTVMHNGDITRHTMAREESPQGGFLFRAQLAFPQGETGLWWYYFELTDDAGGTLYYGGHSGEGQAAAQPPPAYQVTVYDPAFTTPAWFREGIIYQIFPDRFCKAGDAAKAYAYHRRKGRSIRVHTDWYEQPYHEGAAGAAYDPNDFFGGDLWGVMEKLPYLKSLGVTCIYLNPVFESPSNHRYNTADYRNVDPILGGNEALCALSEAAYRAGVQLMLDGVFSHTGDDSRYFNKYGRYNDLGAYQSQASPYYHWYRFKSFPAEYQSWWGFPTLPEVEENDPSYRAFIMEGKDSLIARWAKEGVTNWRLDVADELPDEFIAAFRAKQKELDANSVLLGEVWEDASNKETYGDKRNYVFGAELDSVMNYPFANAVLAFFAGRGTAYDLNEALQALREHYPKPFWYACMNLLSTHDSVRAINTLAGAPGRDALPREAQAAYEIPAAQLSLAKRRFLLATALQMLTPGTPSLYYGDEAGLTGMADPFNRACYPWGREDEALLGGVRGLCTERSRSRAVKSGFCRMWAANEDVYCVLRFTTGQDAFGQDCKQEALLLIVNRSEETQTVTLTDGMLEEGAEFDAPVSLAGEWRSGAESVCAAAESGLMVTIPPVSLRLLRKN